MRFIWPTRRAAQHTNTHTHAGELYEFQKWYCRLAAGILFAALCLSLYLNQVRWLNIDSVLMINKANQTEGIFRVELHLVECIVRVPRHKRMQFDRDNR